MKIRSIVGIICDCLTNYSPAREDIYQYVEGVLQNYAVYVPRTDDETGSVRIDCSAVGISTTAQLKNMTDQMTIQQRQFISDVCCGVASNRPVLKSCTDLLYAQNPQLLPSARNLYYVLFYYTIFELLHQPFSKLRAILVSQQASVILPFLRLVWEEASPSKTTTGLVEVSDKSSSDEGSLDSDRRSRITEESLMQQAIHPVVQTACLSIHLRRILESYFDETYVRGPLTRAIVHNCYQEAIDLIAMLSQKSEAKNIWQKTKTPHSITPPSGAKFNAPVTSVSLSKKVLDIDPDEVQAEYYYTAKKAPTAMLNKSMGEVLKKAEEERKQFLPQLTKADKRTAEWYDADERRRGEVKKKLEAKRQEEIAQEAAAAVERKQAMARKKYAQAPPPRETKATILRANAVVEKALDAEAQELGMYMAGLRDSSEFDMWRAAMLELDKQKRLAEIELHKRDAKLAFEDAKHAREVALKLKAAKVSEENKEHLQQLLEYFERDDKRLQEAQQHAKEQHDMLQVKVEEAKKDLAKEKQRLADERRQEHLQNVEYMADLKLAESIERIELVKQIKAMLEIVGAEREKKLLEKYDASTTAGHGLLDEMSLTELRQRLLLMKEVNLQILENRRAAILEAKENEEVELKRKQEQIARVKEAIRADREKMKSGADTRVDFSVYQKYIDAVQESTKGIIESYEKELEKRMKAREEQTHEQIKQGEVARAAANALRQKLNARAKEKSTVKIFTENTLSNTYTKTTDMFYTKAAYPGPEQAQITSEIKQKRLENMQLTKHRQEGENSERKKRQQADLEQQKRIIADEAAKAAKRKKDLHQAQKEWELMRDRNDALRDPYRASVKGAGHTGRDAGMYEGIFI
ncbi:Chromosome segregation protein SMC [Giardia duodenalis assemblage B]|uniref:Chromosome segregation protein SMC n=1 Tax=Giardia duodenalis assemblage B TaxID=1394984 RepID=A0A132NNQ4_GIAIN|nr:Chromosome segregation protein SMC [Giardia intestinalis assemblage B]